MSWPPADRPPASRRLLPDTRWRDTLLAVCIGAVVLAFVLGAVWSFSRQAGSTGGAEGVIVGREFVSAPETQITIGKGGMNRRRIDGEYFFRVRVPPENKVYKIYVDPSVYEAHREGDRFYFIRPQGGT